MQAKRFLPVVLGISGIAMVALAILLIPPRSIWVVITVGIVLIASSISIIAAFLPLKRVIPIALAFSVWVFVTIFLGFDIVNTTLILCFIIVLDRFFLTHK
jgi:hypothetical protein